MLIRPRPYRITFFFLIIFTFFTTIAVSDLGNTETSDGLQWLHKKIDHALTTSILKNAAVGIQIVSVDSGEIIYERNPERSLNPASNTKLITSAAALVHLTPQYRFHTSVYTPARLKNGTLQGDLYLKGGGDPVLTYEALIALAQEVYNAGVRSIAGDIVGDDSFLDAEREFSGWHDFDRPYSGKMSALSLYENEVRLLIHPSHRSGLPAQITLTPPTSYIQVRNKAVTLSSNKVYASFLPPDEDDLQDGMPSQETLLVQGKISRKSRYGVSASINVDNPSLFTTTTFKDALEQVGLTIEGQARLGTVPAKSRRLARHESEPLSSIICVSNKSSSNFVAEQLLKTLGAEVLGVPGTTAKGLQVVQEFLLEELDVSPDSYVLENGSGLSRNNRLSPAQIVTLLTYMYDNFAVRSEYLASLAVAGVDGTLRRRLRDTQAERRLRAKTGAIRSVSCLSGYVASRDNEILAFSIMMNDYTSGGYAVKDIQNKIGLLLTEFYRQTYNVRSEQ
ncbi:D-alanyl-D-alanine carboxypeptidase/D-alanyl-D-alanine-endopeptidase [candidate division KSB3 bacterium]|uniref:D-alanyl-D-alanine carboxypeptidase/D-alanyl-D-alanine-endopeptidase n=1 Tax=candidate division KSB3 bacterium TaxID=2044937 RepID=A0A9D5JYY0_9BACT|nr:D-alanyl-D-alanine carboxypeptidase/D-alanyl-D-alanine-endopeptidase [candidate division KSB3 bacterium]MBD3326783.1 D-alanyl-D-alanine carboxypeptidase/D-alanyl-D-alanine-endopeptidase [candidate division KSB3 bacterium]